MKDDPFPFLLQIQNFVFHLSYCWMLLPTTPVERHQNQAQKQGILEEKVTSMAGLKIEKYPQGPV